MNILKRIQGIIDYDTCDMQEDERDALRADLSCIYKAVQQQAEQIADYKNSLKIAEGEYEQLGREYDAQAEQIARLKKELNHGNEGYQILRDEITKLKGE